MTGENPDATGAPAVVDETPAPSALEIAEKVAALVSTPEAQTLENDVLAGLPKRVRGSIYAVGGGLGAIASGTVSYALANPGVFPAWAVALASIAAPILIAFTGGTAWASLGKK